MGTRHWPEDADEEVERLENEVERLKRALLEAKQRICALVDGAMRKEDEE